MANVFLYFCPHTEASCLQRVSVSQQPCCGRLLPIQKYRNTFAIKLLHKAIATNVLQGQNNCGFFCTKINYLSNGTVAQSLAVVCCKDNSARDTHTSTCTVQDSPPPQRRSALRTIVIIVIILCTHAQQGHQTSGSCSQHIHQGAGAQHGATRGHHSRSRGGA